MVEMKECAQVLGEATEKSLIILDEVGRGTSTYDGLALAWAIMEDLVERVKGFTLFATHYHELIALADSLPGTCNLSGDIEETGGGILFLHKIKPGGMNRSFGLEVAKLAGIPMQVVDRATELLSQYENKNATFPDAKISNLQLGLFAQDRVQNLARHFKQVPSSQGKIDTVINDSNINPAIMSTNQRFPANDSYGQEQTLNSTDLTLEKLHKSDINSMTPLEALNFLNELRNL